MFGSFGPVGLTTTYHVHCASEYPWLLSNTWQKRSMYFLALLISQTSKTKNMELDSLVPIKSRPVGGGQGTKKQKIAVVLRRSVLGTRIAGVSALGLGHQVDKYLDLESAQENGPKSKDRENMGSTGSIILSLWEVQE